MGNVSLSFRLSMFIYISEVNITLISRENMLEVIRLRPVTSLSKHLHPAWEDIVCVSEIYNESSSYVRVRRKGLMPLCF